MEQTTIFQNLKDLLISRGDDVSEYTHQVNMLLESYPNFFYQSKGGGDDNIIYMNTDNTTILLITNSEHRTKLFKQFSNKLASDEKKDVGIAEIIQEYGGLKNFLIIFKDDANTIPTPSNKTLLVSFDKELQKYGGMMHDIRFKNLMYNPLKHSLVPPHRKLSLEEIQEMMNKYLIKQKSQIPYILKSDPISKWIGLKTGDIVEIERYNINSGLSYYYRCCV
jgi:DNA-directed RNA polymerase subunit H (RpoH/RPB5)